MKAMKENPEDLTNTRNRMNDYLTTECDKQVVDTVIDRIKK